MSSSIKEFRARVYFDRIYLNIFHTVFRVNYGPFETDYEQELLVRRVFSDQRSALNFQLRLCTALDEQRDEFKTKFSLTDDQADTALDNLKTNIAANLSNEEYRVLFSNIQFSRLLIDSVKLARRK